MTRQTHTNKENDIAKDTNFSHFLQNPYHSYENDKSWNVQPVSFNSFEYGKDIYMKN